MAKKKVGIQLPKQAQNQTVETRYSLELEALAPIADIVDIRADTPEEFAEGVKKSQITPWPFCWTRLVEHRPCSSTRVTMNGTRRGLS